MLMIPGKNIRWLSTNHSTFSKSCKKTIHHKAQLNQLPPFISHHPKTKIKLINKKSNLKTLQISKIQNEILISKNKIKGKNLKIKNININTEEEEETKPKCVYLVGTGPGDPGLLTIKALELMQTADVVLYDRLISEDILKLVHGNARMVYVGKQKGYHTRSQEDIHQLMLQFAESGWTVLRLKGGDPYIFGRGGEEMQYLQKHGIQVRCIPGVTAASGISSELGIPLTHRGMATSVRFITGHSREGGEKELEASISSAIDPRATLVIYMGLQTLPLTVEKIIKDGQNPNTPSVAIEKGTTVDQRVLYVRLKDLPFKASKHELVSPTLVIIGDVVSLSYGWTKFINDELTFELQIGKLDDLMPKKCDYGNVALSNLNLYRKSSM